MVVMWPIGAAGGQIQGGDGCQDPGGDTLTHCTARQGTIPTTRSGNSYT